MTLGERLLLVVLMCGSATTALVLVVPLPVLPLMAQAFGGGSVGAGLSQAVMTAPALGLIAGGLVSAAVIKSVGALRLLMVGLAVYGLAGPAGLYLSGATPLLASRVLLGVAASFVGVASTALIAALYPPAPRARLLGFKGALGSVGGISGILIGGELGSFGGWRLPFSLYLIGWLLLILVLVSRRSASVAVTPPVAEPAAAGGLAALWPFYVLIVAFGVVLMMTNTQLSFLLGEIGISEPSEIGRIAVTASVGAVIGGLSYGRVRLIVGPENCFVLVFGIWTVGLAVLGFAGSPGVVVAGCGLAGIAAGLFLPHMIATLTAVASDQVRDRAIALFFSAIFLGDFLNPFIVEPMSVALTRHGAFRAVAVFTLLAMIVALLRRGRGKTLPPAA